MTLRSFRFTSADVVPLVRLAALAALSACSVMRSPLPPALQPQAPATLALSLAARGVQVYECREGRWAFVAPQAELVDAFGRTAGTHGAGPFWQAADGSRVVARVAARADAPVDGAIPWLLLDARADGGAAGLLSGVTHIQRINTAGGSAPATPCDTPGRPLRVPYSADYHFFRSQP